MKEQFVIYPYKIIEVGGKKYLYIIDNGGLYLLDSMDEKIITKEIRDLKDDPDYKNTIEYMKEHFIIKSEENEKRFQEMHKKELEYLPVGISKIILMICQECNFRCQYCFGDGGEYNNKGKMSFETAKRAVDFLVEHAQSDDLSLCFFGGEPLLNFPLIKQIDQYVKEIESKSNKKFKYAITTNGSLITPEIEKFLEENVSSIMISMDGNKEIQDTYRYYTNKMGTYDIVTKRTEGLRKKGLVSARMTLVSPNFDIVGRANHLLELGFRNVAWAPALNLMEDKDFDLMLEGEKKAIWYVNKLITDGNIALARRWHGVMNRLRRVHIMSYRFKGCGAASNMVAVNIDGTMYPCHRFVGQEDTAIGNIEAKNLDVDSFVNNTYIENFEKCASCWCKNLCIGGCINENYSCSGDITVPKDKYCNFLSAVFEEIMKMYLTLEESQIERLFPSETKR